MTTLIPIKSGLVQSYQLNKKTLVVDFTHQRVDTFLLWMQYKQKRLDALKTLFLQETKPADFDQQLAVIINDRIAFMSQALINADDKNLENYVKNYC